MNMKSVRSVGVVGAGTMGRGIAHLFALYGYEVRLVDKDERALEGALLKIKEHTNPLDWDGVEGLIQLSTDIGSLKDCDIVIEAVYEDVKLKKSVLGVLSKMLKKDTIIATNTSSISINELSGAVSEPSRFIGMHFMNPPKVMKLIEIVKGEKTSEGTVEAAGWLARELEKIPAVVNDTPGFVTNRLVFALLGEALRLYEKEIATKETIDSIMKFGLNHTMGPFELADFIGLDVVLRVMEYLHSELKDEKYRPSSLLESLVSDGKLGRKTGEGFYKY